MVWVIEGPSGHFLLVFLSNGHFMVVAHRSERREQGFEQGYRPNYACFSGQVKLVLTTVQTESPSLSVNFGRNVCSNHRFLNEKMREVGKVNVKPK